MALIKYKVNGEWVNGGVGSVNGKEPDALGNVEIDSLPDTSGFEDGTVLVKVGDEWKPQGGYGWSEELECAKGTCEEDPEVTEAYKLFKIADVPELPSGFGIGSYFTVWSVEESGDELAISSAINVASDGVYTFSSEDAISDCVIVTADDSSVSAMGGLINYHFEHSGIYVLRVIYDGELIHYVSGFAFGEDAPEKLISWDGNTATVHTFDPNLLPNFATQEYVDNAIGNAIGGAY